MRLLLGSARSTIKKGLTVFIQSNTVKNYSYFAGKYSSSSDYHTHRQSARFRYFYPRFVANSRVFNCNCETAAAMSSLSQSGGSKSTDFFFRQLFDRESCTYTYLLADLNTKEAIIIDPVIELSDRDAQLVRDLNFNLIYAVNTHMHADHITGTGRLKSKFPSCKSVIAEASGAQADIYLKPGDKITFGQQELEVRATPGHTSGCLSYVSHKQGMVFTGDALLIRGCGRTDFQGGSSETLYDSIHNNVFTLPKQYVVFPAHDYKGQTTSTVGEEATLNPRLTKSKTEFIKLMKELNLPYPKKIDVSLPANKVCGLHEIPDDVLAKLQ